MKESVPLTAGPWFLLHDRLPVSVAGVREGQSRDTTHHIVDVIQSTSHMSVHHIRCPETHHTHTHIHPTSDFPISHLASRIPHPTPPSHRAARLSSSCVCPALIDGVSPPSTPATNVSLQPLRATNNLSAMLPDGLGLFFGERGCEGPKRSLRGSFPASPLGLAPKSSRSPVSCGTARPMSASDTAQMKVT